LENVNGADLIERLTTLEYAVRRSITVREDQDEPADAQHKDEAKRCGIALEGAPTKEELLNAVQTLARATQRKMVSGSGGTVPK
jgi:hypothetical protein